MCSAVKEQLRLCWLHTIRICVHTRFSHGRDAGTHTWGCEFQIVMWEFEQSRAREPELPPQRQELVAPMISSRRRAFLKCTRSYITIQIEGGWSAVNFHNSSHTE
jgi:hypothetical protein